MRFSKRFLWRLRSFLALTAASSAGGPIYRFLFGEGAETGGHILPVLTGLLGGTIIWGFELLFVPSRQGAFIRRLPFIWSMALRVLLVLGTVTIVGPLARVLTIGEFDPLISFKAGWQLYLYVLAVTFLLFSIAQIIRIIGPRVLVNIVLGHYQHPVREERIFLFLDIKGSTPLSQKLGDAGVQAVIAQFFFDIAEPVLEWGGEIHNFIGDAAIVTWKLNDGVREGAAIRCCFAIQGHIRKLAPAYMENFGVVPEFRIGLHGGPVVAAQCGDVKQQIVYFGDTINTAARVQDYSKQAGRDLLISGELLEMMQGQVFWNAESLGAVHLRGRESEIELYAISR